jgi:hypothetical protein
MFPKNTVAQKVQFQPFQQTTLQNVTNQRVISGGNDVKFGGKRSFDEFDLSEMHHPQVGRTLAPNKRRTVETMEQLQGMQIDVKLKGNVNQGHVAYGLHNPDCGMDISKDNGYGKDTYEELYLYANTYGQDL